MVRSTRAGKKLVCRLKAWKRKEREGESRRDREGILEGREEERVRGRGVFYGTDVKVYRGISPA